MSQKCPTCQRTLTKPPSYEELLRKYPDVHPSFIVNHNYLRCRWCDLQTANKRAIEAELPPPKYTNPVKEVEEQIQKATSFIEQGVFKDDMERILPRMRQRLADLIKERDRGIRNAWLEYWGIWGKEDGPIDL